MTYLKKNELEINTTLFEFINNEILPGTDLDKENFWKNFGDVVHELAPINKALIEKRESIQKKLILGIKKKKVKILIKEEYIKFLK